MGDNWITLKKVFYEGCTIAGISLLTYFADTGLDELALGYPEYIMIIVMASAGIRGFLNWYKHRND